MIFINIFKFFIDMNFYKYKMLKQSLDQQVYHISHFTVRLQTVKNRKRQLP